MALAVDDNDAGERGAMGILCEEASVVVVVVDASA